MINNYLSPLEFQVTVKRMPNVEFFVQRALIPSVSADTAIMPTPFNRLHFTPDKLTYNPLDLTFIIDENMKNYMEILSWIKGTTFPETYKQHNDQAKSTHGLYSDISIVIMNSHKQHNIEFNFKDCQPTSLSEVSLDTTHVDVTYPQASVMFAYNYFDVSYVNS